MINEHIENLMMNCDDTLIIHADACVTVREENNLLHALMLLSSVKHSEIPVLNKDKKIVGLINMPLIVQAIKTETAYQWNNLENIRVKEAMRQDVGIVQVPLSLENILHKLVNYNFVSVSDQDGVFLGIITRKEILTRVNHLAHQMDSYYDIEPKEDMLEHLAQMQTAEVEQESEELLATSWNFRTSVYGFSP